MKDVEQLKQNCDYVAQILKTVAHPQRLLILCSLVEKEKCVNDLLKEIDISQSQLSQFLKRFTLEGLVSNRKEGNFSYYKIQDEQVIKLIQSLHRIFRSA